MFCSKCGVQNSEGSKFCINCGEPLMEGASNQKIELSEVRMPQIPTMDDLPELEEPNGSRMHCPKCKSEKIQALTETNVQGGYRAGRGCMGWLLFGPLGLLCGALGKKSKVSAINNTTFICMECGFRFPNLDEMIVERERKARLFLIGAIVLFIFCLLFLLDDFSLGSLLSFLVPMSCMGMYLQAKEERNDLVSKGYDASCFHKKDDK